MWYKIHFNISEEKVSGIVDFTAAFPEGSLVAINYDNISVNGKGSTKKTYLFSPQPQQPPIGKGIFLQVQFK